MRTRPNELTYIKIQEKSENLADFAAIYKEAFPKAERKDLNMLMQGPAENRLYSLEGQNCAMLSLYPFKQNTGAIVEYLAVAPSMRSRGIGRTVMEQLKEEFQSLVLEVEVPENPVSQRRLGFYKRLGFTVQSKDYWMPDLAQGGERVPLWLLRWPEALPASENYRIHKNVHQTLYRI